MGSARAGERGGIRSPRDVVIAVADDRRRRYHPLRRMPCAVAVSITKSPRAPVDDARRAERAPRAGRGSRRARTRARAGRGLIAGPARGIRRPRRPGLRRARPTAKPAAAICASSCSAAGASSASTAASLVAARRERDADHARAAEHLGARLHVDRRVVAPRPAAGCRRWPTRPAARPRASAPRSGRRRRSRAKSSSERLLDDRLELAGHAGQRDDARCRRVRQSTAGAPPIGLTIGSAPAGSRAILRRLSVISANGT